MLDLGRFPYIDGTTGVIEVDDTTVYTVNDNTSIKYLGKTIAIGKAQSIAKIGTGLAIDLGDTVDIDGNVITVLKSVVLDAAELSSAQSDAATAQGAYTAAGGATTDAVYVALEDALNATTPVAATIRAKTADLEAATTALEKAANATDVAADKAALDADAIKGTNSDLDNVTADLTLITTGSVKSSAITWVSSKPTVVATDGTVNPPAFNDGDATVTLTATIKKGTVTDTKTFTVTVTKAAQTKLGAINAAKTVAEMRAAIEAATGTGELDLTAYNGLVSSQKDLVAQDVLNARPAAGFADFTAAQAALDAAI